MFENIIPFVGLHIVLSLPDVFPVLFAIRPKRFHVGKKVKSAT